MMYKFGEKWYSLTRKEYREYKKKGYSKNNRKEIPNPECEKIFEECILEWEAHTSVDDRSYEKIKKYLPLNLILCMLCCIDSSSIIPITECEQDDAKYNRSCDCVTSDDCNRVAYCHDLYRESGKSFEEGNNIENEIHKNKKVNLLDADYTNDDLLIYKSNTHHSKKIVENPSL